MNIVNVLAPKDKISEFSFNEYFESYLLDPPYINAKILVGSTFEEELKDKEHVLLYFYKHHCPGCYMF